MTIGKPTKENHLLPPFSPWMRGCAASLLFLSEPERSYVRVIYKGDPSKGRYPLLLPGTLTRHLLLAVSVFYLWNVSFNLQQLSYYNAIIGCIHSASTHNYMLLCNRNLHGSSPKPTEHLIFVYALLNYSYCQKSFTCGLRLPHSLNQTTPPPPQSIN